MSVLRFEFFLVISMAIVSHFHKLPRKTLELKLCKEPVEKCYEGLGCVKLTSEWKHRRHRPVNLLPADRHAVNTIFVHWTLRQGNATAESIGGGTSALKASGVGGVSDLRILIHDFTSNGYTGWIQHLAHALMTSKASEKLGVVSVDWAAGAEPPYAQAVANARLVALELVLFLKQLKKNFGIEPAHIHIIGHGVGAHTAGYVGKLVPGIRRITALDPSGAYFRGMPPNVKLHRTDAAFVDVVHTDCGWGGQGNKELTGHVDFFPNGGHHQPGCGRELSPFGVTGLARSDLKLGEIYHGCSHKRAFKYYIESLTRPDCLFVGYACPSYDHYLSGECLNCGSKNENCTILSPLSHATHFNHSVAFYFITSANAPFCVETLQVSLGVQKSTEKWRRDPVGYFDVTIPQTGGDVKFLLNEHGVIRSLRAGYRHTFLVRRATPPVTAAPPRQLRLTWHRDWVSRGWGGRVVLVSNVTLLKLEGSQQQRVEILCGVCPTTFLRPNESVLFRACAAQDSNATELTPAPRHTSAKDARGTTAKKPRA